MLEILLIERFGDSVMSLESKVIPRRFDKDRTENLRNNSTTIRPNNSMNEKLSLEKIFKLNIE